MEFWILWFLLKVVTMRAVEYPCYTDWLYNVNSGKCYRIINNMTTYQEAVNYCNTALSAIFPQMSGRVFLSEIRIAVDAEELAEVLASVNNNEIQWLSAIWNASLDKFSYPNGDLVNFTGIHVDTKNVNGNCMVYRYFYVIKEGQYYRNYSLTSANCAARKSFVCEHSNVQCDQESLPGFNGFTMQLIPKTPQIEQSIRVECKMGYYRISEVAGSEAAKAQCTGTKDASKDPSKFKSVWSTSTYYVEECVEIKCHLPLPNISRYSINSTISVESRNEYPYRYQTGVICARGYVNYKDNTRNSAELVCNQSTTVKSKGEWNPIDMSPCSPVKCDPQDLKNQIPLDGRIILARHKRSLEISNNLNDLESISIYDMIITISCPTGTFFFDRKVEKKLMCDLKNMSTTEGALRGYNGDKYPFPSLCIAVTCIYEDLIIRSDMKLKSTFYIMSLNGSFYPLQEHSGEHYQLGTRMVFFCVSGYKSATGNSAQNVTCGTRGLWEPQLTACIEETDKLNTGNKKHYIPTPKEASNAKEVGYVVIIILVLFLSIILLLDLSTFARDIQLMSRNIKNIRNHYGRKKKASDIPT